jgi:hypothetical protein
MPGTSNALTSNALTSNAQDPNTRNEKPGTRSQERESRNKTLKITSRNEDQNAQDSGNAQKQRPARPELALASSCTTEEGTSEAIISVVVIEY